jgi:hypothetical protein
MKRINWSTWLLLLALLIPLALVACGGNEASRNEEAGPG